MNCTSVATAGQMSAVLPRRPSLTDRKAARIAASLWSVQPSRHLQMTGEIPTAAGETTPDGEPAPKLLATPAVT